ncbi:MAG TPA: hypothetical protein RMI62_15140, partial [Polyangiaceae bacterium LLY-WYZ-15_(1-7)]|nr:hypothetical protein [Polyangiaceae bacterium LLY-WYZ-15_(1-7)]
GGRLALVVRGPEREQRIRVLELESGAAHAIPREPWGGQVARGGRDLLSVVAGEGEATTVLRNPESGEVRLRIEGAALGHARGVVAVRAGDELRFHALEDGALLRTLPAEDATAVSWHGAQIAVDRGEARGERTRRLYDARTLEPRGAGPLPTGRVVADRGDVLFVAGEEAGSVLRVRLGAEGEPEPVLPSFFEEDPDAEPYDATTGMDWEVGDGAISPDGTRVALARGPALHVLDVESGEERLRFDGGDAGERSVWGVVPTAEGLITWGRSSAERWGPDGLARFACGGQGRVFGEGESLGWSVGGAWCPLGGEIRRYGQWDDDAQTVADWIAGSAPGGRLAVATPTHVLLQEPGSGRTVRRLRAPRGFEIECYEEGCSPRTGVIGGRLLLSDGVHTWIYRGARPRQLFEGADVADAILREAHGDHALVGRDQGSVVVDRDGEVVLEMAADYWRADLADDGSAIGWYEEGELRVADLPSAEVVLRAPLEGSDGHPLRVWLVGDTAVAFMEAGTRLFHLPSASSRLRFSRRIPFGLSEDGSRLAICENGRLSVRAAASGAVERALGPCVFADGVRFVGGGRFVAVNEKTRVVVHRLEDGARLEVRRSRQGGLVLAQGASGWWSDPPAPENVRYREAGPLLEAPFAEEPAARRDDALLRDFFQAQSEPSSP